MSDEGASSNTTNTGSSKHSSRMTLLLLSFIRRSARLRVVVSLMAMRISKQTALIVAGWWHVRRTGCRRSIWARW